MINDTITALDIASYLFEERRVEVKRCAGGYAAIDYVKSQRPDLIIVDLMVHPKNGAKTMAEIRSLGIASSIIAFTAVDEPIVCRQAEDACCNKVLTKPCRPEKPIDHIRQLLPDASMRQGASVEWLI